MAREVILLPEEEELARLEARLHELEDRLADQEEQLATLRRERAGFLARYLGIVGVRLAALDRLEADIAAALADRNPSIETEQAAEKTRVQAEQSSQALGDDPEALAHAAQAPVRETPEEFKRLYRKVAKAVHPDLASDERDRQARECLMAEANRAYEEGDARRLQGILDGWSARPESVGGDGVGARLIRTIRLIAAVETRLAAIVGEIAALASDDLEKLREEERRARADGRDLLQEMADELDVRMARATERLAELPIPEH